MIITKGLVTGECCQQVTIFERELAQRVSEDYYGPSSPPELQSLGIAQYSFLEWYWSACFARFFLNHGSHLNMKITTGECVQQVTFHLEREFAWRVSRDYYGPSSSQPGVHMVVIGLNSPITCKSLSNHLSTVQQFPCGHHHHCTDNRQNLVKLFFRASFGLFTHKCNQELMWKFRRLFVPDPFRTLSFTIHLSYSIVQMHNKVQSKFLGTIIPYY